MTGQICPECGGEQSARPGAGCACGAGGATRPGQDARSAEIAAAEDFDPLRIRPYVTLSSEDTGDHGAPDAATTMPLFLDGAPGREAAGVPGARPDAAVADENRRRSAAAYAGGGPDPVQPRRRRPFVAVAVGAAVAAVVGTAAFAGGLFDDEDGREAAALPEVTTSVPDASDEPAESVSDSPSASPSSPTPSSSASASASASPSASPSTSRSPSATPSATAPQPPSPSAVATKAPTTAAAAPPVDEVSGTTLQRGDSGAEVSELQRRLQEIWVYRGPDNGDYSAQVEQAVAEFQRWVSVRNDPPGVYGPETRGALEAQTSGRGRR
ncbi:peptidoglycan-binding protein [Streptomyces sp. NPDC060030]|uniref:peptidoglycan-binding domain-containing protein n=1 Tax=Streptomyces sp. NPDC060030 TaxID=3347042 RepID=UPI0036A644D2